MQKRIFLFLIWLIAAWCVMTFTHEAGHILGGWLGGGKLKAFDLVPWHLPYSLFEPDPHPLLTLWSGPLLGVLIPLLIALVARRQMLWFIAHFCFLANGAYLAVGWCTGEKYLDTTQLLEAGAHPALLLVYCLTTIVIGYVGFRRQCRRFWVGATTE